MSWGYLYPRGVPIVNPSPWVGLKALLQHLPTDSAVVLITPLAAPTSSAKKDGALTYVMFAPNLSFAPTARVLFRWMAHAGIVANRSSITTQYPASTPAG